jgi:hypothetical protein
MGPAIARMFVSFGFGNEYLPISIEVRKTRSKESLGGRGLLPAVRADLHCRGRARRHSRADKYRKPPPEEVYMFRAVAPIENIRRAFLDHIRDINADRERPRFYNT